MVEVIPYVLYSLASVFLCILTASKGKNVQQEEDIEPSGKTSNPEKRFQQEV